MAIADLIPTGRTSLVKRGNVSLQVQTEYAYRPLPRITTTVQKNGQVLQKIERALDKPIQNIEEKNRMEVTIRKQHTEVLAIIKKDGKAPAKIVPPPKPEPVEPVEPAEPAEPKPYPEPGPNLTIAERLEKLPGQHTIYRIDNEGNFVNSAVSSEFKKQFKPMFKNLHDLISIFASIPGIGLTRESGVYEVDHDSLYLISTGTEFFILAIQRVDYSIDYEIEIRAMIARL